MGVWLEQAKIGIWKLSPQRHISFYSVFFDRKYTKAPRQISVAGSLWKLPKPSIFFFDLHFSKFETESCPPSRKCGDLYCGGGGGSLSVKWIFNIKSNVPDSSKNFEGDSWLPLLDELRVLWCTESHIELGVTFYGKGCQGTQSNLIPYMERKKIITGH